MEKELSRFLDKGILLNTSFDEWGEGTISLKIDNYLGIAPPPLKYVSSVRAIVFQNDSVLVVRQESRHVYILPGGRVEEGESLTDTLEREVLEETGWTLSGMKPLGFMYFHHLSPKPPDYKYPYPDFLWPVYTAEAGEFKPEAIMPDDFVYDSAFHPCDEVRKMPVTEGELLLLDAAIKQRKN
jgi:8-oxo-dGTP pyrophosphatase MutT (NUDIX family)